LATEAAVSTDALIEALERNTFRYFWEAANPANGLVRDRYPSPSPASIAAVGFALAAYPIGAERGYVSRAEALDRTLTTLRFLNGAPQGDAARGATGHKGFFYHYLDMETGERTGTCELSTVDTAILLAGVLFAQSWFDGDDADEAGIRALAEAIYVRVDWRWAQVRPPAICLAWRPEEGPVRWDWRGYNEAMIVYLLALGSPTFPVEPGAWEEWTSTYGGCWGPYFGKPHLAFASLFGHILTHSFVDFRGIRDGFMASHASDYFENSRRAILAQRQYAIANPHGFADYGPDVWGLSASDGPGDFTFPHAGGDRIYRGYAARGGSGPDAFDDGTLSPPAVVAALGIAPEVALPAVAELHRCYGRHIWGRFGFVDAFNPSFDYDVPLMLGRRVPGLGWVDTDHVGIAAGQALAMIENFRSGLVWRVMRKNPHVRRGLRRAGFKGGWLDEQT
jgi:hypothetical protein